jgi:hypothetical protein
VLRCCLSARNLVRTASIAAVVGTGLFAINQLDVVVAGHATARVWLKIGLTYAIPFLVANYGVLMGSRRPSPEAASAADTAASARRT